MTDKSPAPPAPSGARGDDDECMGFRAELASLRQELARERACRPAPQAHVSEEMLKRALLAYSAPSDDTTHREAIRRAISAALAVPARRVGRELRFVCDGPPGPEAGRFVECEDENGKSFKAGEWIARPDGLWELRVDLALISGEREAKT